MRTITLVTQKGGTGKTTLAASLAVAAAQSGETVIALDLDPQGSLATWGDSRSVETLAVDRLSSGRLSQLPAILAALKNKGFTVAVLDTPGAASTGVNLAMQAADLALIPARPSRLDLQATIPTVEALMRLEMRERFAFVLNQCPAVRSSRALEAANGLSSVGVLAEPSVTQRVDHQDALATGQGVTEYASGSKAADEIRSLWAWADRTMKGRLS
ncbi:AAA family ATPase [Methylobacterium oxalidis]|uniref:Chromosome partitioning protein ParA n=1 Tax=Methylobacterium oxalidis TaxID=944322 RepID=A0A512JCU7_9HYPH|nr:AAA family ATPase [Methylobacterium oxalidis]GEP07755.1 chromosome partitioning protein ParA [Methylobacterium oxalidis]GJE35068.1 Protein virC1 [Methylobacterium oxalidis]GLS65801.1 chromosome partitioning protein ParA [Methylobacterium oxalidis]